MALDHELVVEALAAYEVDGELGRGAFGIVLAARHRRLGREAAVKQLPRVFGADPSVRARFHAEARLLATLDHPHIVPIYDYVEHEGLCLLVMERLTGGTLMSRFRGEGFSQRAACAVTLATCAGLHYAHEHGVLHRDVKPENVMFSAEGVAKVTDFGIAKVVGGLTTMATKAGYVVGTPAYIAPEQAQAAELGPGTDVYAAGTMLYELLSGQLPYSQEGGPATVLYRHVHEEPRPLVSVAPEVPGDIAEVVMRSLARSPADRYATAEEFGVALARSATKVWGTGWPADSGVTLRAAGPIVDATTLAGPSAPTMVRSPVTPVTPATVSAAAAPPGSEPSPSEPPASARPAPATAEEFPGTEALVRPTATPRPRRRRTAVAAGVAVLLLVGGVAAALLASGGRASRSLQTSATTSGIAGLPGPTAAGSTTERSSGGRFTVDRTSGPPGTTVNATAVTPCPPPPSGWTAPVRAHVILYAHGTDVGIADQEVPAAANGSWSGSLSISTEARLGPQDLKVRCDARDQGGNANYYFLYDTVTFTVTPQ